MQKLFEVIPEQFFNLLTGKNKEVYADVLHLIYEQSIINRFGIPHRHLRDYIEELLEAGKEGGGIAGLEDEGGVDLKIGEDLDFFEDKFRLQSNAILRRLEELKWIQFEVRDGYEQFIVLPHYTNRMLSIFKEFREAKPIEYQRYAYATYQTLIGEEVKLRPAFVVREAHDYTCQLEQELLLLYQNMKNFTDQLAQKSTVSEVLDHHFDVYQDEIAEKSYHRLKTSDHVSRYRFQILQKVKEWLIDDELIEETILDSLENNFYKTYDEGQQQIRFMLHEIEEIYENLDEIFREIDVRHNQYLRSSYDRARYMSQTSAGDEQRLVEFLTYISTTYSNEGTDEFEIPPIYLMNDIQFIHEKSLLTPRNRRPPHQSEIHHVVAIPDEWKEKNIQDYKERLRKQITREKVEDFVNQMLGTRDSMEVREIVPESLEQYLMIGFVLLYGADSGTKFRIHRKVEREIVEVGEYRYSNHIIHKGRGD